MSRLTITAGVLRGRDGRSELVIEREPDGRIRITVHDDSGPGCTTTFDRPTSDQIADFIKAAP